MLRTEAANKWFGEMLQQGPALMMVNGFGLFVSSIGCGGSSWVVPQMLRLINGRAGFADYERADARIAREANVPYVLIRPAALKEKPGNGKYRVFKGDGTFARPMAKEDVAAFLFDALDTDQWDGKGGFQLAGRK